MVAAVSPLVRNRKDENQGGEMARFSILDDDLGAGDGSNFIDSIDFDDLFIGIDHGYLLPDLEMECPEILAELSVTDVGREEADHRDDQIYIINKLEDGNDGNSFSKTDCIEGDDQKQLSAASGLASSSTGVSDQEIISRRDDDLTRSTTSAKEAEKSRKSSSGQSKNSQGKRKMKVDWTPELHRRFVQTAEQLGEDKAVPSRILELMGIDCLTRHNIASHLQKYRSHRKHLLAREVEAASWNQRRQMHHGPAVGTINGGNIVKRPSDHSTNPWFFPAMGFPSTTPPVVPPPPIAPLSPPMHHLVRSSLPVWGHPPIDQQSLVRMTWPRHLPHSPPPPLARPVSVAGAQPILPNPSFWYHPHTLVPSAPTLGTPCFPQALAPTTRQITLPPPVSVVPAAPPLHAVYKADPGINGSAPQHPPLDIHPSKESIDAAFGDVLSKPWLPLPLGLKPPSQDGVMEKLQRHGVPNIPPLSPAH